MTTAMTPAPSTEPAPPAPPAAAPGGRGGPELPVRSRRARWLRRGVVAGLVALLLVLVLYAGAALVVVAVMAKPKRSFDPGDTPARFQIEYKDVRFPARGGDAEIAGWYLPHAAGRFALVMVHGKDSSRTREHGHKNTELMAALYRKGFAILAIDLRGHGQSSDARLTFGQHEHRDVLGAVDYLRAAGYPPGSIGAHGVSLGGASVLLAAAREPAIGAVASDCAFADIEPVIRRSWRERTGLPTAVIPASRWLGERWLGVDILGARPVDDVPRIAPRPALFLHGGDDTLVPPENGKRLHAALPGSELVIFPGIRHASLYLRQPEEYVNRVAGFFERSLKHEAQPLPR
jgi:dipeptidyl aminopeptidase/acylaminoacyl peptidase